MQDYQIIYIEKTLYLKQRSATGEIAPLAAPGAFVIVLSKCEYKPGSKKCTVVHFLLFCRSCNNVQ
jgi:hypothetical protein